MPRKNIRLVNNEIYHIIVRGVGDSEIFKEDSDYYRAIFSLYEFNTSEPVTIREKRKLRNKNKIARGLTSGRSDGRDLLVELMCFAFLPNHIHLLMRQLQNSGITNFMRKFGTGYATYFNLKYKRRGHLFQGRYRAVHIKSDSQLKITFSYIHTNRIAIIEPGWKENGIKLPIGKIIDFLENDKWSSYRDYLRNDNFPSVTSRDFLLQVFGGQKNCKKFIVDWIKYKADLKNFDEAELE